MADERVYIVGEDGKLEEITDNILFSVPIPSDSEEDTDVDEDEIITDKNIFFTRKSSEHTFRHDISENEIIGHVQPSTSGSVVITNVARISYDQPSTSNSFVTNNVANIPCDQPSTFNEGDIITNVENNPPKQIKRNIVWKKKGLIVEDSNFYGNTKLPEEILNLKTPYEFFNYFFNQQLIDTISKESSLYSSQVDPGKPLHISASDIQKYLGICTLSSVVITKKVRLLWHSLVGINVIKETMGVNTFEKIR